MASTKVCGISTPGGFDAAAVDVFSGVERERGVKDPGLIRGFVQAAGEAPGA